MPNDDVPNPSERARALARLSEVQRRANQRKLRRRVVLALIPAIAVVLAIALPLALRGNHRQSVSVAGSPTSSVPSTTEPSVNSSTAASPTTVQPSTTSSTTTTTSTEPGPVPSAPNCTTLPGNGVKPKFVVFGCATSNDNLSDIQWDTWTATSATGRATHNINDCLRGGPNPPSCADGHYTSYPVNVTLSNPGQVSGEDVFRTIVLRKTSANEPDEASTPICPDPQSAGQCDVPNWGYMPDQG